MADTPILMPQLGESVTEGTIAKWLKKPGDRVEKYEALAEVITDKVNAEIPAPVSGVITRITVPEGATVAVKQEICRIDESGEGVVAGGAADIIATGSAAPLSGIPAAATTTPTATAPAAGAVTAPIQAAPARATGRYSPAVLRLAQEHNLDLSRISGTGTEGRVTRKDVLAYLERGGGVSAATTAVASSTPNSQAAAPAPAAAGLNLEPGDQVIEPDPVRRRIAERMVQAKHEAPHAWTMIEADVTNLVRLRAALKDEFKRREGVELTYLPFVIKAAVEALKEFPQVNSSWMNGTIIVRRRINISIAVATENALVVPVIKDADQKSIAGLAHVAADLAARARAGRLTLDDVSGGTFTVDNTGSFGSILSQPILNPPQAAIMTLEAIVQRPVVVGEAIAIRSMVNVCMSLDHRVLDGLVAGRFLQAVRRRLESYGPETPVY